MVAGIIALCVVAVTASAAVRKVPSQYPRIQSAIDASENGDTVLVAPGVYYETINFGGRDIVVTSTDPNDPKIVGYSIINADGDGTTVTFENGETQAAVLTGFTITGGFGTLDNEVVGDNTYKLFWGAGIYCKNASPTITRNVIVNNRAPVNLSSTVITEDMLSYGGGIVCFNSSAVITHNIIKGNYAYAGGGVMTYIGNAKVANNLIYDNSAALGGGVVMIQGQLINNTIVANNAGSDDLGGQGGNVYLVFDPSFENCFIWNNIICNATTGGGIVWESGDPQPDALRYNDVWNNLPGNYAFLDYVSTAGVAWDGPNNKTGTAGNISADPLFANPLNKDYHLTVDSPCINAGNPDLVVAPGERDIDRAARVYASRIDIGADEYVGYVKPAADAGADRHVLRPLELVTLDGGQSFFYDPCGVKTYHWSQVSGPPAVLNDPNGAKPTFTPVVEGEYVFQLVVADNQYASGPDKVLVLVAANRPPVADAGPGKAWKTPGLVTLDGTDSFDPDKVDQLSYQWTQVEGSPVLLRDANTAKPSFSLPAEGAYGFELVVSDGFSQSEPSRVQCVGVTVTATGKPIPATQLASSAYYPDVSGTNAVYSTPGQMSIYDARITCQDLVSGKTEIFGTSGINLQPKIDGNLVVWSGGVVYTGTLGPDCTSVLVRNLATGVQRELRSRSNTSSYSHPAVSGSKVVWVQHLGIDKNVLANWSNMPYDICGADVSNLDKPVYFTIATAVGKRDPYPYRSPGADFDHVVDISGNLVVWEGNGNIYAADVSDLDHLKIVTVCDHPARQYDPAISGRLVVWTDERNDRGDIYGADLSDWEHVRQFQVAKAPGMQSQPMIDGCHVVYTDGGLTGGQIRLACVTRQYGILNVTTSTSAYGAIPTLDGMTFLWTATYGGYVQGQTLRFSYSVPDGRVQSIQPGKRTGKRYDYIQHAICDASDGDQIVVSPDRYEEKISFAGKSVTVRSTDPNDPVVVEGTVLTSTGTPVSFTEAEGAGSVLSGFTIEGGNQGILDNAASPTIMQCTIRGSREAGVRIIGQASPVIAGCRIVANGAAGIEMSAVGEGRAVRQGEVTLRNCIIAANGAQGVHGGKPKLINCTVVENAGAGVSAVLPSITNSILYFNDRNAKGIQIDSTRANVTYSDVQGGWEGDGNIDADPLFAALGRWSDPSSATSQVPALNGRLGWVAGDYHLKSQGRRWNPKDASWVSDGVTSPCIDAGDPASALLSEPLTSPIDSTAAVVNTRIDMGAYGGTAEASLAPSKP
jgi:beta propeller repeat protein